MTLPSKELLSKVMGFEIEPVTGKQLIENSFGYKQGVRTKCAPLIPLNEWIALTDSTLIFGYKDKRPEVLKNIPEGVFTYKKINVYELACLCKTWVKENTEATIYSGLQDNWISYINGLEDINFTGDSEPEVVFKACEVIMLTILSEGKK